MAEKEAVATADAKAAVQGASASGDGTLADAPAKEEATASAAAEPKFGDAIYRKKNKIRNQLRRKLVSLENARED